jgi:hypothetical protein
MVALVVYYFVVFVILAVILAWSTIEGLDKFKKAPIHKQVVEIAAANVKMDREQLRGRKFSPAFMRAAILYVTMGLVLAAGWAFTASAIGVFAAGALARAIEQSITMHIARKNDVPMDLVAEAAFA